MERTYAIASASWPDHLVFGEGDGRLDTPDGLKRRLENWRNEKGARILHWREVRTRARFSHFYSGAGNPRTQERAIHAIDWDDFEVVPRLAHSYGMKAHLYVSVLDEGRPLADDFERRKSYHNAMHGQHVTWQTDWSRDNPHYTVENSDASIRQWGVSCYGYPEVRRHMVAHVDGLVKDSGFDGVFVCLRSQCRPADHADQFGFNRPVRDDYLDRYGEDIRTESFDVVKWRSLLGSYLTEFLRELKATLKIRGLALSVGVPRGEIIGPPIGNWSLDWRSWVRESIVDEIVIDQNSSQCPSMWHPLWPMHRGTGYLQNYIDGTGLKPLSRDIAETYAPVLEGTSTELFVARQWSPPDKEQEEEILAFPFVSGLVFSTFRHDNPDVVRRGDYRA